MIDRLLRLFYRALSDSSDIGLLGILISLSLLFYTIEYMSHQSLFPWFEEKTFHKQHAFMGNVITDRGSKYSVSGGHVVGEKTDIKQRLTHYLSDKYFKKATHNTYAYRITDAEGFVLEGKNDDGETGAGQCILTVLQRENMINCIVVVTRYFWGVHLQADRFRHVIDATKIFVNEYGQEK